VVNNGVVISDATWRMERKTITAFKNTVQLRTWRLVSFEEVCDHGHESCCQKLDSLGYIYVADSIGPKAAKFDNIVQNKGHYEIQGHSRLLIFVPVERPYSTSYW